MYWEGQLLLAGRPDWEQYRKISPYSEKDFKEGM